MGISDILIVPAVNLPPLVAPFTREPEEDITAATTSQTDLALPLDLSAMLAQERAQERRARSSALQKAARLWGGSVALWAAPRSTVVQETHIVSPFLVREIETPSIVNAMPAAGMVAVGADEMIEFYRSRFPALPAIFLKYLRAVFEKERASNNLAAVPSSFPIETLQIHPSLRGIQNRALLPLSNHYAKQFGKGDRGAGRVVCEELGTVLNVFGFSLTTSKESSLKGKRITQSLTIDDRPILTTELTNNPDPLAHDPDKVDYVLLGLHGATHAEKSLGAGLLIPCSIIQQQAREEGISVVSVIPDMPLHGLGPTDPRFLDKETGFEFYMKWLEHLIQTVKRAYPKARILAYGRSTGGNQVLELAYRSGLVNSVFGDAAYPPETLELQSLAIQKREERARLENPDLEEYQTVPGSAEMLEAHDSQWTFWRPHRKPGVPHSRFIARQGESDDNYSEFNHTAEWKRWGQQNGVRVIIDRGEHNGLGGLQQQADTKLFQISMQNVRLIIDMMQRDLRKKTWWMTRDVNRRRAELNLSKKVLGGLQMKVKAARAQDAIKLKEVARAEKELSALKETVAISYGALQETKKRLADALADTEIPHGAKSAYEHLRRLQQAADILFIFSGIASAESAIKVFKHELEIAETSLKGIISETPSEKLFEEYSFAVRQHARNLGLLRAKAKSAANIQLLSDQWLKKGEGLFLDAMKMEATITQQGLELKEARRALAELKAKKEVRARIRLPLIHLAP
ncbi:MAG: hypothetical protein A2W61_06250 [Deltaproteobacteria bacterium RIFCSPLOWO2_01_44_7]|nr:MAG: hypothetical protein A2712_01535 [Deltaproteobacteria bacterium RIFCSPHIGHO2_01_FULL_43_49]OGQ15187.1 MAG: hypothetical protein A3D22_03940 [Deltaproteobacteria bacterium RIFCSPHIGHO2_02_FULL_44_53]OGQ27192.1 MAG: hypothetical protein A3D98_02130 [Deltaproteobacteria bacterium RIFCSPHIGHO2_12_FULL_44_21]OGQ31704.1 MAG: hypothetical protein A2979_05100 [Deltaproteobacteria bacterium RIFCSPLOWO2_01_FULL_45_74]OGQ38097.1 MAG: hypothetical protein A2W61_06250 [Deltaproteobacteria bacterium 